MECPQFCIFCHAVYITIIDSNKYFQLSRQTGQDSVDEVREKDFKRDLEERERQAARERTRDRGSRTESKRSRLDQVPATNLDADDPVDDDDSDDSNERFEKIVFHKF